MERYYYNYPTSPLISTSVEPYSEHYFPAKESPIQTYDGYHSNFKTNLLVQDQEYKNIDCGYYYSSPYNYYYKSHSNLTLSTPGDVFLNQQKREDSFSSSCFYSPNSTATSSSFAMNNFKDITNTSLEYSAQQISTQQESLINNYSDESKQEFVDKIIKNNKEKTATKRRQLSDDAIDILNEWFDEHLNHPYPKSEEKERLALRCNITLKQVNAWFSNRRNRSQNTKPKRIQKQMENEIKSLYQLLASNSNMSEIIERFPQTLDWHEHK